MSALLLGAVVAPMPAEAAMVTLTFEGGAGNDLQVVGNSYSGIVFTSEALFLVDSPAGTGGFENEPSPDTVVFFTDDSTGFIVNVAAGFQTAFSFWYAATENGSIAIYDGPNGTGGSLLQPTTTTLAAQSQATCGGELCEWTFVEFLFSGTAQSIVFSGTANQIAFDDMSFGSNGTPVPLPAAAWLLLSGLASLGYVGRRKLAA